MGALKGISEKQNSQDRLKLIESQAARISELEKRFDSLKSASSYSGSTPTMRGPQQSRRPLRIRHSGGDDMSRRSTRRMNRGM